MSPANNERLFEFRFGTRTLLIATAITSVIFAISPWLATDVGFFVAAIAMMIGSCLTIVLAGVLVVLNTPRSLGRLLVCHSAIALFVIFGPIASYHINGRAWYDYGLSGWNPPPFRVRNGPFVIGDYDPKFTRPMIWPMIGPIMLTMSFTSLELLYVPPTAPVVSLCVLVSTFRLRHRLSKHQLLRVLFLWACGLVPTVYMYCCGRNVIDWLLD